jgi:hypothetical protein
MENQKPNPKVGVTTLESVELYQEIVEKLTGKPLDQPAIIKYLHSVLEKDKQK